MESTFPLSYFPQATLLWLARRCFRTKAFNFSKWDLTSQVCELSPTKAISSKAAERLICKSSVTSDRVLWKMLEWAIRNVTLKIIALIWGSGSALESYSVTPSQLLLGQSFCLWSTSQSDSFSKGHQVKRHTFISHFKQDCFLISFFNGFKNIRKWKTPQSKCLASVLLSSWNGFASNHFWQNSADTTFLQNTFVWFVVSETRKIRHKNLSRILIQSKHIIFLSRTYFKRILNCWLILIFFFFQKILVSHKKCFLKTLFCCSTKLQIFFLF